MDHTAGIVDLPKDIPYVAGKNERYANFRFIMQSDHLARIDALQEIDFATGIDLPPLGKAVDLFGDGSLWAISSSGHSAGHVMFLINGIDEQVLYTGDACNDHYQFETGIGPGYYSSDLEGGQEVLERIILFKERYPEVKLVYGHDLKTH
jgi:glyoxylase-like metal-dependent hydrolase (beta-lactamase superfamily II)